MESPIRPESRVETLCRETLGSAHNVLDAMWEMTVTYRDRISVSRKTIDEAHTALNEAKALLRSLNKEQGST
jgi:hypothetical protein